MSKESRNKKLLLGSALAGLIVAGPSLAVTAAPTAANAGKFFQTAELSVGYRVAQAEEKTDDSKDSEKKCSADKKCGGDKKEADKKCAADKKCGGDKKEADKKCGADKKCSADKKCGADKKDDAAKKDDTSAKAADGKCGAGSCG